jgi:hypothetical protein
MELNRPSEISRTQTASRLPHILTRCAAGELHATSVSESLGEAVNNVPNNASTPMAPAENPQSSKPLQQPSFLPQPPNERSTLPALETLPTAAKARWSSQQQGTTGSGRNNKHQGPPLSMITQGYYDALEPATNSTTNWVAQQSIPFSPPLSATDTPLLSPSRPPLSRSSSSTTAQPLIKPIRGFKPSRNSLDMASRLFAQDPDSTLRQLEGYNNLRSPESSHQEQDNEQNSDESDLFLRAAREEEESDRQAEIYNDRSLNRSDSRKVCLSFRSMSGHLEYPVLF